MGPGDTPVGVPPPVDEGVELLVIGGVVGLVSGYFGGAVDLLVMRLIDIMLAFPSILLAIVICAVIYAAFSLSSFTNLVVIDVFLTNVTRSWS